MATIASNSTINSWSGSNGNDLVVNEKSGIFIYGGGGNDTIRNSFAHGVIIEGEGGNDIISHLDDGDNVTLNGGDGNDTITSVIGDVTMIGGAGKDIFQVNVVNKEKAKNVVITDYNNEDKLKIGAGSLSGGYCFNNDLTLYVDGYNTNGGKMIHKVTLKNANTNNNVITVVDSAGNEVYFYASGIQNLITGNSSNSVLKGTVNDDYLYNPANYEKVRIWGDIGNDYIYNYSYMPSINAGAGNDYIISNCKKYDGYKSYATIYAGDGNDTIYNYDACSYLSGGDGDDKIFQDTTTWLVSINGGKGNDEIERHYDSYSGAVYEYALGDGNDTIKGFVGGDRIKITKGVVESVYLDSFDVIVKVGDGKMVLKEAKDKTFFIIDDAGIYSVKNTFTGHSNPPSTITGKELVGTAGNSVVVGTGNDDVLRNYGDKVRISGENGNDYIYNYGYMPSINAGAGNDYIISNYKNKNGDESYATIYAGDGNDTIYNGDACSYLSGGDGDDKIFQDTTTRFVSINGGKGNDEIERHYDSYSGAVYEYALGDGNDTIKGFGGGDRIKITKGVVESVYLDGFDVIVKVGDGKMVLKEAKDKTFKIIDDTGSYSVKDTFTGHSNPDTNTGTTKTDTTITTNVNNKDAVIKKVDTYIQAIETKTHNYLKEKIQQEAKSKTSTEGQSNSTDNFTKFRNNLELQANKLTITHVKLPEKVYQDIYDFKTSTTLDTKSKGLLEWFYEFLGWSKNAGKDAIKTVEENGKTYITTMDVSKGNIIARVSITDSNYNQASYDICWKGQNMNVYNDLINAGKAMYDDAKRGIWKAIATDIGNGLIDSWIDSLVKQTDFKGLKDYGFSAKMTYADLVNTTAELFPETNSTINSLISKLRQVKIASDGFKNDINDKNYKIFQKEYNDLAKDMNYNSWIKDSDFKDYLTISDNSNSTTTVVSTYSLNGTSVKLSASHIGNLVAKDHNDLKNVKTIDGKSNSNNIILVGNSNSNSIIGGSGQNSLWGGGQGDNTLTGGSSRDQFWHTGGGNEIVTNFVSGGSTTSDVIVLQAPNYSGISRNGSTVSINMTNGKSMKLNTDSSSGDGVFLYSADGSHVYGAKVGGSSDKSLTYTSNANYYQLGGGGTLNVNTSNNVVALNGSTGETFVGIQNISVSGLGSNIVVGNGSSNSILGGSGLTSLWGSAANANDTLIGGSGSDMFWYGRGEGDDVITNSNQNDSVNFYNIGLSEISSIDYSTKSVAISFNTGQRVTVKDSGGTSATMIFADGQRWKYNHSENSWQQG